MRLHPKHLAVAIAALAAACGGSNSGNGTMSVHLVDGPAGTYSQVNVDVQTVSIHSAASGWIQLGAPAKVVNLLALTGGVDEKLVDGVGLPAGHYDQMRLELGDRNTCVPAGQTTAEPMKVPSGTVKLVVSFDVAPNTTKDVFIDFDANKSVFVHQAGNSGQYILRPVVQAYDKVVTGAILGTLTDNLSPAHALPGVTVTAQVLGASGPAVARTVKTDSNGRYVLDLLPVDGTYHVVAQPVVLPAVYAAKASDAITITASSPTANQDLAFAQTASFGTLHGAISPPAGDGETDVVTLLEDLPADAATHTFVVGVTTGGGTLSYGYGFSDLPFGSYDLVVTHQAADGSFTSAAAVPVNFAIDPTTLDLTAP